MKKIFRYQWEVYKPYLLIGLVFIPGACYLKIYDFFGLLMLSMSYMLVAATAGSGDINYLINLPVSIKNIVIDKYIFSLFWQVLIAIFALLVNILFAILNLTSMTTVPIALLAIGISLIMNSFPIYLSVKGIGSKSAVLANSITIVIFVICIFSLMFGKKIIEGYYGDLGKILVGVGILATVIFILLSLWELKRSDR